MRSTHFLEKIGKPYGKTRSSGERAYHCTISGRSASKPISKLTPM